MRVGSCSVKFFSLFLFVIPNGVEGSRGSYVEDSQRDPSAFARDDKLTRSISRVGAFPLWRSRFVSVHGATEPPVRAKHPKELATERVLVLAESRSAIR